MSDAPPPEAENDEHLTKREAAGCLFDGCACAGCVADAAVVMVALLGVAALAVRFVLTRG